jgi:hypothetical protein
MTAPITGMYCDRCGARHEFERARPSGVARLRSLTRGVRGYVMNETPSFGDAMTDAWSRLEEDGALEQYAEVQKTFSFCLDCRGYVCHDCWNAEAGRCLTCVPLPGTEAAAGSVIAGRLDLVAGPGAKASPAVPTVPTEPAAPVVPPDAGATALEAEGPGEAGSGSGDAGIENVDPAARLAWIGIAPDTRPLASPATPSAALADETATDVPEAGGAPTPPAIMDVPPPDRNAARPAAPHRVDDDADVIAAAVAAGIILPPTPLASEAPEPTAKPESPTEPAAPAAEAAAILAEEAPAEPRATIPAAPGSVAVARAEHSTTRTEPEDDAAASKAAVSEAAAASAPARRGPDRRRSAPPPRRAPAPAHCRHCGLQVPAVARFCRRCGGRQTEDAPVLV